MMKSAQKAAFLGLLTAACVVLSLVESALPALPFLPPGAKAGFSNIITMFAASFMGIIPALLIAAAKALFVLLTRGLTAFFMSLCGGILSTLVMWLCCRLKGSLILTGILGAVSHNTAQLIAAILLTATPGLVGYYPFLLLFALIAGIITGYLLKLTYPPLCSLAKRMIAPPSKKRGCNHVQ